MLTEILGIRNLGLFLRMNQYVCTNWEMEIIDISKPCAMSTSTLIAFNNIILQGYVQIMYCYSFNIIVVRAEEISHRTII